jgi:hypothetical protein
MKKQSILFLLVYLFALLVFAWSAIQTPGVDFRGYYGAALLVRRGGNPYDYTQLAPVLEEITGFQGNNPYFYPPWYCLAFIPLTYLPFRTAQIAWIFINLALFTLGAEWLWEVLDWDIERHYRWLLFVFASILFGFIALRSENSGFVLLFALALTLRGIKRNHPALAGLGLLLMATKPQALGVTILALTIWAWRRQRKIIYWAAGWLALFLGMTSLVFPRWWDFDKTNFGLGISYYQEQAGVIAGKRVNSTIYDWARYFWHLDNAGIAVLAFLALALGIFILWKTWNTRNTPVYIAAAATLLTLLITPYALQYDFVPLTLVFFLLVKHLDELKPAARNFILASILAMMLLPFFATWMFQMYWDTLLLAIGYALLLTQEANAAPSSLQ